MAYTLEVHRRARRTLEALATSVPRDCERIEAVIDQLLENPRPRGATKLGGVLWRVRIGDYRVVYSLFDQDKVLNIECILRRNERTYRHIT